MAPPVAKKAAAASKPAARDRRSVSRHSTPVSALTENSAPPTPVTATPTPAAVPRETAYLKITASALLSDDLSIEQLISGTSARGSEPPTAKELNSLHDRIRDSVNKFMGKRGEICDRGMRQLMQKKKERIAAEREEEAARQAQEMADKREREDAEKRRAKKEKDKEREKEREKEKGALSRKRSRDEMEIDGEEEDRAKRRESLPSVGAHGLARQDGVGVHEGQPAPPSPPVQPGTAALDPMDVAASPADSEDARTEPPATIPLYERAFGKDPSTFDDPTIYDIRPPSPGLPDEEIRERLNVLHWPRHDISGLTAGDPPDQDFSNAKPANQVNFSTFQTYVEPYIRPFTEEDAAFLKERGDRFAPYVIPNRGNKSYKDIWAAEDGLTGIEAPAKVGLNPNEARGSMEDMDDATAETDEVSHGPIMERMLSILRPQPVGAKREDNEIDASGDTSMINGTDGDPDSALPGASLDDALNIKPATALPLDFPRPSNIPQNLDYATLETRMQQELTYLGFLSPTDVQDFAAHNDDEIAARLRTLQHELRRVSRHNNIRKARVLELTEERMAMQEYTNIADDLDGQVNAAYLKRNRSLQSKPSKKGSSSSAAAQARAAAAAGRGVGIAGVGGRGVSEGVKALMQKRRDWIDMIGPAVHYGRPDILGSQETIFNEEILRRLERGEREAEVDGGVGEGE
ncbi:Transcriptional regulator [Recurvomyces mirabilis]|uniref:Transcriptional regulator n=1 Tax=Recurvomyces mirabilis TaxID=574656 RepID=A0AAE0WJE3_9PEZI|nr:Transcriptional regulator [Recurvomyces mirabilis]KAK5155021.1 Transcriptional regulator [Recurvomyces mirabilis]